ncbi:MAG: hypothetical protein HYZ53_08095 [Planctomycetes bacterium]|nr:hypothetical protein [Planctomycetota bacterium]
MDTSYEAEQFLFDAYRRLSPSEKTDHLIGSSRFVQELKLAGLRLRYPNASEEQLRLRLAAFRLGRENMIRLLGLDPNQETW